MNCAKNAFCRKLDDGVRKILCESCRRSKAAAGSLRLHSDFESHATIVLSGLILYSIRADAESLDVATDSPSLFLAVPGHVLSTDMSFNGGDERYDFTSVEMLTDCHLARIDHESFRKTLSLHPSFANDLLLNLNTMLRDSCLISAILRTGNATVCVKRLIEFLATHGVYLTQLQIASLVDRNRASVSRAIKSIKSESPELWDRYLASKPHAKHQQR